MYMNIYIYRYTCTFSVECVGNRIAKNWGLYRDVFCISIYVYIHAFYRGCAYFHQRWRSKW